MIPTTFSAIVFFPSIFDGYILSYPEEGNLTLCFQNPYQAHGLEGGGSFFSDDKLFMN